MKKLFLLSLGLLALSTISPAQARESFDIATFQIPPGWTKVNKDGVLLLKTSNTSKGTFALISLFASGKSSGIAATDFNNDWRQFVKGQLGVKESPEMEPAKAAGAWQINSGGASFESQDLGRAVVMLNTFSGSGRAFSLTALFNSTNDLAAIEGFLVSIDLKAPPPAQTSTGVGSVDNAILGTWGQNLGAHMTYGDPVAAGMAGYSKDQYTFNANGTYTFVSKTFRMSYDKIILVKENGTFETNGANLTIKPQKSVIQAWSKLNGGDKFGRLLTTQNRTLETVTYRYTKHYFSGIDQWQLVLQADRPTERDGPFSTLTLFTNAWYYKPISANNPVVELPQ
jgi:hypothetical protein